MKVIFDTKILKSLDKEIDDYYKDYKEKNGITDEVINITLGMRTMVSRIREIITEED